MNDGYLGMLEGIGCCPLSHVQREFPLGRCDKRFVRGSTDFSVLTEAGNRGSSFP